MVAQLPARYAASMDAGGEMVFFSAGYLDCMGDMCNNMSELFKFSLSFASFPLLRYTSWPSPVPKSGQQQSSSQLPEPRCFFFLFFFFTHVIVSYAESRPRDKEKKEASRVDE